MGTDRTARSPRGVGIALIALAAVLAIAASGARHAMASAREEVVDRTAVVALQQEASAALARGDSDGAVAALKRALELVPGDPGATFSLAQVTVRAGSGQEALDLLVELAGRNLGFHPDADPEFEKLSSLPGYQELLQTLDRLEPRVARSKEVYFIHQPALFPEGIACDRRDRALYVSSILERKIVRIAPGGQATDFVPEHQDGLYGVLGMKIDTLRKRLWAAASGGPEHADDENRAGLWTFDLRSGKLLARYLLPADTPHLLNDLDLDGKGNVYATDTATGAIYRAAGGRGLEPFVPAGTLRRPNGIALSRDGRYLYVASAGRGLSVIDVRTQEIRDLRAPADVVTLGIDGLYFKHGSLLAVQNGIGRPRIVRYVLAEPDIIENMEILESRNPLFDTPTTAAICRGKVYYVANPHLDHAGPDGALKADEGLTDLVVLEMPLP